MTATQTPARERRSLPERPCGVCLQGVYATRLETDAYSGSGGLAKLGVTSAEPDVLWHVEACDHCGHVQVFRRDWRREV
jgi:hypothetical protein